MQDKKEVVLLDTRVSEDVKARLLDERLEGVFTTLLP
jgi:hypothetical protein